MINNQLKKFIEKQENNIRNRFPNLSYRELSLLLHGKIIEEFGEFTGELLTYFRYQRKEKMKNFKFEKLEEEFVDLLLTVLILGEKLDIDIDKSLKLKMKKVEERNYDK